MRINTTRLVPYGIAVCLVLPGKFCALDTVRADARDDNRSAIAQQTVSLAAEDITVAAIEAIRRQVADAADLDEDSKKKADEHCQRALEQLGQVETLQAQSVKFRTAADNVQQNVDRVRGEIESLDTTALQPVVDATLADLEQQFSELEIQAKKHQDSLAKLEAEAAGRATRREEIRRLLLELPHQIEEVGALLQVAPQPDENSILFAARRAELLTRRRLLEVQTPLLENELAKYDAEKAVDLLRWRRDHHALLCARLQPKLEQLSALLRQKREQEAKNAVERAEEEKSNTPAALKPLAEKNRRLAEQAQTLGQNISAAELDHGRVQRQLRELDDKFSQTRKMVEKIGRTGAIGLMLRKQRTELPNLRRHLQNIRERKPATEEVQFSCFEYARLRSDLADLDRATDKLVTAVGAGFAPHLQIEIETNARQLLGRHQEYLTVLERNYDSYFDTLVELDNSERQLVKLTQQYQKFIDEHVLWIRSSKPFSMGLQIDESDRVLTDVAQWQAVGAHAWQSLVDAPLVHGIVILIFLGTTWVHPWLRRRILALGETAARSSCADITPTIRAAAATVALSAAGPALIGFVAWRLSLYSNGEDLTRAVSQGLWITAGCYLPLELLRNVCRSGGLADLHFDWSGAALQEIRSGLRILIALGLPLVSMMAMLRGIDAEHGHDVLERIAFVAGAVLVSLFLQRILRPQGGLIREFCLEYPGGWVERLKHLWWALGAGIPLALAGLSLWGYHYSACELSIRLFMTVCTVAGILILRSFLLRLILVVRRRLSMAEAQRRRAENAASRAQNQDANALSPQQLVAADDHRADLKTHSVQTSRLVGTAAAAAMLVAIWMTWSDVVPALGFLNRWTIWTTTIVSGATETEIVTTLADLGAAVLIAVVTFVAARNIPGLMEIALLQRLPIEKSVRYAVTTLSSYAIVLTGVVIGCQALGLRWSQIQWLATALTFGLAFGLQEMFANFVAGLILLFERPMRVGDIVTIDDTTGVVSRIRIRATTITNWDHKEYIVPNKEFITGKLLNWTLSDQVNRIVISVGVAYGTDTELARELLLKVANDHPSTLDDPPSMATFEGFGDSCLDLVLRTFLPNLENRLPVVHDLYTGIDKAFREAGIEIAFPQRDLHVRTIPGSLLRAAETPDQSADNQQAQKSAA